MWYSIDSELGMVFTRLGRARKGKPGFFLNAICLPGTWGRIATLEPKTKAHAIREDSDSQKENGRKSIDRADIPFRPRRGEPSPE